MNAWERREHWPVCYRSQRDAGIPKGPILDCDERSPRALFAAGILIGLLLTGPALCDLYGVFAWTP